MKNQHSFTMIDLFAGCGGLSLGMENAGFRPVFVSELNEHAMATYLANRHHEIGGKPFAQQAHLHCGDAHDLQGDRLEQLVTDLEALGLRLPTKEEAEKGKGVSTLDLLAGGPPCQGFSGIGHRRSYPVDKRDIPSNQLYQRMAAIISRLRPRIFLFENVRGLLNSKWHKDGDRKIWPDVLDEFRSLDGYEVRWSVLRAGDYGVPQNRPRVLLVGVRKDVIQNNNVVDLSDPNEVDAVKCGFLPAGGIEPPTLLELLDDLVDPTVEYKFQTGDYPEGRFETKRYPPREQLTPIQEKMRQPPPRHERSHGDMLTDHEYSRHSRRIVEKFQHMIDHGEIPDHAKTKKFAQRVLPKTWGNRPPSITATSLPDDYVHYAQPRTLTVREWARLQLFPDWYRFEGKRTTGGIRRAGNPREGIFDREVPKYTQIGNAVPVGLAEEVGKHFRRILEEALRNTLQ